MRTNETPPNDPFDSTPDQEVGPPPIDAIQRLSENPALVCALLASDGTIIGLPTGKGFGLVAIEYDLPEPIHPALEPDFISYREGRATGIRYFARPGEWWPMSSMMVPEPFCFWPDEPGRAVPDTDLRLHADDGYVVVPDDITAVRRILHDLQPVPAWLDALLLAVI